MQKLKREFPAHGAVVCRLCRALESGRRVNWYKWYPVEVIELMLLDREGYNVYAYL